MLKKISTYFEFDRFNTNLQTEFIAGLSTYLSLAYIFILNPAILSTAGIDPSAVLFATVIASGLATIAMGLWAKLPFAVAPGLEMNGFFAFVVCGTMGLSWQQGLGTVFISGILCVLLTLLHIRKEIIEAIPAGLKNAIATTVGVFVATIGLFLANIVVFDKGHIDFDKISLASFTTPLACIMYIGLFISALLALKRFHFHAGMLVAIIISAILCAVWGIKADQPPQISTAMFSAVGQLDLSVLLNPVFWSPILIFFIIDFVGGIGKFIGLTANTNIRDNNGDLPNIDKGLIVDGVATSAGAMLGTSSMIAFVESAVGIKAGGRTGLTAIICGLFMLLTLAFTPILLWVPAQAAAGVLLFVGYLLLPDTQNLQSTTVKFDIAIAIIMGIIAFATFSLDKSLALGFLAYGLKLLFEGNRKSALWLFIISFALIITIIAQ